MILTILLTLIGIPICAVLANLALRYLHTYRLLIRSQCFRGPKALPFIGSMLDFTSQNKEFYEVIADFTKKYPSPFRLWLGPYLGFVVHDATQIKLIMNNPNAINKPDVYKHLTGDFLGDGLVNSVDSKWKQHRKILQPLFHHKMVENYLKTFISKALKLAEVLGMQEDGKEVDIHDHVGRYSFENICETMMGVQIDVIGNENCIYFTVANRVQEAIPSRLVQPWLRVPFIFRCTAAGRAYYKATKYLHEFNENVFRKAKYDIRTESENSGSGSGINTILRLIAAGDCTFTDDDIHDETITLILGGFETTANALAFAIYILANYPDIQEKVYEEILEIWGERKLESMDLTMYDLGRMEYTERVLKETLRLYPATAYIARELAADMKLGEYTLPAGSFMAIDLMGLHRNEKYWPQPLEFIPDRFLPNHPLSPRDPAVFIPFTSGIRMCIGPKYAMASMKVLLTVLVSKYIFKTRTKVQAKDLKLEMHLTLKPKWPLMVMVERRLPGKSSDGSAV